MNPRLSSLTLLFLINTPNPRISDLEAKALTALRNAEIKQSETQQQNALRKIRWRIAEEQRLRNKSDEAFHRFAAYELSLPAGFSRHR